MWYMGAVFCVNQLFVVKVTCLHGQRHLDRTDVGFSNEHLFSCFPGFYQPLGHSFDTFFVELCILS